MREEYGVFGGRFSLDMRFLAYASDEANSQSAEVYVRPFDARNPQAPGPGPVVRVSKNGVRGFTWRKQDGKELYLLTRDLEIMAVEVTTSPTVQVGTPRLLFKLPSPLVGTSPEGMSHDGQRFVVAMPVAANMPAR